MYLCINLVIWQFKAQSCLCHFDWRIAQIVVCQMSKNWTKTAISIFFVCFNDSNSYKLDVAFIMLSWWQNLNMKCGHDIVFSIASWVGMGTFLLLFFGHLRIPLGFLEFFGVQFGYFWVLCESRISRGVSCFFNFWQTWKNLQFEF